MSYNEYKVIQLNMGEGLRDLMEEQLNAHGQDGWTFTGLSTPGQIALLVLQRRVESSRVPKPTTVEDAE